MVGSIDRRTFVAAAVSVGTVPGCLTLAPPDEVASTDGTTSRADRTAPSEQTQTTRTTEPSERRLMSTVFHFAKEGESNQRHALANVANLLADDTTPTEDVVLVANGRGVAVLVEGTSAYPEKVSSLVDDGVSFRACENSLEAQGISKTDLLPGVETVPAGVGELTKLQTDGYAYIETP